MKTYDVYISARHIQSIALDSFIAHFSFVGTPNERSHVGSSDETDTHALQTPDTPTTITDQSEHV